MPKLVSDPKPKRVDCDACEATIEYLPEEVEHLPGGSVMGDWEPGTDRVKCPRAGCPGFGIVSPHRR